MTNKKKKEVCPIKQMFGKRIQYVRKKAKLSQGELALMIHDDSKPIPKSPNSVISNYESGERMADIKQLELINRAVSPLIGDHMLYLTTGKHIHEYLEEVYPVERENYIHINKASESIIETLKQSIGFGLIKVLNEDKNETLDRIITRFKSLALKQS